MTEPSNVDGEDEMYAVKILFKSGKVLVLNHLRTWELVESVDQNGNVQGYIFRYEFYDRAPAWLNYLDPSDVDAVVIIEQTDPDLPFSELDTF